MVVLALSVHTHHPCTTANNAHLGAAAWRFSSHTLWCQLRQQQLMLLLLLLKLELKLPLLLEL